MYRFRLERAHVDRINQGEPVIDTTRPALKSGLPHGMRLVVPIGRDARKRLQIDDPAVVGVRIEEIAVYPSATRVGQLVFSLSFAAPATDGSGSRPMTAGLLMEALYSLSHDPAWRCMEPTEDGARSSGPVHPPAPASSSSALCRLDREGNLPVKTEGGREVDVGRLKSFALRDLAWSLIGPIAREEVRWERAFTYTVAGIAPQDAGVDDAELVRSLAVRFARRHNAAYAVADSSIGIEMVQPFETACHAAAIEGGAVIVSPRGNTFLKGYVTNTGPGIYLPIALAAHKEMLTLLNLSQGAAIPVEHGRYEMATVRRLSRLRDHLYNFRLAHRFSTVSLISMHNAVFEAWRRAFRSEQLLKDVNDDVLSSVTYLRDARREHFERRFGWIAVFVAAGVAYAAASPAVQALITILRRNYCPAADQTALLRSFVDAVNLHKPFAVTGACTVWTPDVWDALVADVPSLAGFALAAVVILFAWLRRERA